MLALAVGTNAYKLFRPFFSGIGHILLFHRVCKQDSAERLSRCSGLEVSPEYLEGVIRFFLKQNYEILSLGQLFDSLRVRKLNKRCVVFTLDDGYLDNLIYAYPVFKKFNIPFAIYITTGFPDRSAVLWWYLLEDLLLKNDFITFKVDGRVFEFSCASLEEKEDVFLKISLIIKGSNADNYWDIINQIFISNHVQIHGPTEKMMLNWQQIRELSLDPLVTIGAHTVYHLCLSNLSEPRVKYEILESKNRLESQINLRVRHFSYPFGDRGEAGAREFKIAKECGFQTATTTRSANIFIAHRSHCQALPRITMGESLDEQRLVFLINGLMHFRNNNFKQVVSI